MEDEWYEVKGDELEEEEAEATLSVHTLEGSYGVDTIRIFGVHKNRQLVILIDSGSTTSFIDKWVAQEMRLELVAISPTTVVVADGRKMCCGHKCLGWKWKMQGYEFQFEVRMLELGGLI